MRFRIWGQVKLQVTYTRCSHIFILKMKVVLHFLKYLKYGPDKQLKLLAEGLGGARVRTENGLVMLRNFQDSWFILD